MEINYGFLPLGEDPEYNSAEEWWPPTLPVALHDASQDDARLARHIRERWLLPPSIGERNLRDPERRHYSQRRQSRFVDGLLNRKANGFYVESGAGNGEKLSNSLFFEKSRNWTGLLVEANWQMFQSLLAKRRHAYLVNACLSPIPKPVVLSFQMAGMLGGLSQYMDPAHRERVNVKKANTTETLMVQCFPLFSILRALNVTEVDYISLDIEGAELDVLYTLPLDDVTVDVFSVEYAVFGDNNATRRKRQDIEEYLVNQHGYRVVRVGTGEDIILKKY